MRNCRDPVRTQYRATTRPNWYGGRRRVWRAWLRCPWAVAGPGGASSRRISAHQRPGPTGVEGVGEPGGPGCGARGRWQGLAGLRVDAPSEARCADGSRAGRRPRARQAARPSGQPGPTRQRVERSAKAEWSGGACLELTSSWAIRQQEPLLIEALWMLSNRALDECCVMRH